MDFRILGPLEVSTQGEPLDLGGQLLAAATATYRELGMEGVPARATAPVARW